MSLLAQTWLLFRLESKLATRNFFGRLSRDRGGWRAGLLIAIFVAALTPSALFIGSGGVGLYLVFRANGQPEAALTVAFAGAMLLALLFGFFYVMSAFFYATDLRILLPMPLRPAAIVGGKFLRLVVGEYLTIALVVLPLMIAFGVGSGGLAYWPGAIVVFLLLPVVPIAIDGIVVLLLMRATAGRGVKPSRDVLRVVLALVIFAGAIGMQLAVKHHVARTVGHFAPKMQKAGSLDELLRSLPIPPHLSETIAHAFPPLGWAAHGLAAPTTGSGALDFVLFVLLSLAAAAVVLFLAGRFWLSSLALDEGNGARGGRTSAKELAAGVVRQRSVFGALFWREWTLVVRTPIFLLNALVPILAFVILGITGFTGAGVLDELRHAIAGGGLVVAGLPIFAALPVGLFVAMGSLASTGLSREGKRFWLSCALPVDPGLQVLAKIALGGVQGALGLVFILGTMRYLHLSPLVMLGTTLVTVPMVTVILAALLAVDLWRPYLAWTDPQQAIKGNIGVLLGLVSAIGLLAIIGGVGAGIAWVAPRLVVPVLFVGVTLVAFVALRSVVALARRRYREVLV